MSVKNTKTKVKIEDFSQDQVRAVVTHHLMKDKGVYDESLTKFEIYESEEGFRLYETDELIDSMEVVGEVVYDFKTAKHDLYSKLIRVKEQTGRVVEIGASELLMEGFWEVDENEFNFEINPDMIY